MEADPVTYPLLPLARRVDVTLRAGQVLLIPGGAPHRVRNGASDDDPSVSVAMAANFVDASNVAAAVADLQLMARRVSADAPDPGAAAAANGLDELDAEVLAEMDQATAASVGIPEAARRVVPYADYAHGRDLRHAETCYWLEEPPAADGAAVDIADALAGAAVVGGDTDDSDDDMPLPAFEDLSDYVSD